MAIEFVDDGTLEEEEDEDGPSEVPSETKDIKVGLNVGAGAGIQVAAEVEEPIRSVMVEMENSGPRM